jgi:RES domain-containing protein
VDIGDNIEVDVLDIASLPANWREYPAPEPLTRIGEAWLRQFRTAILAVPSVVIPHERSYVLNPDHPDVSRLAIGEPEPFSFDPRMWARRKR